MGVKSEIHALIASLVFDQETPSETQDFSVSKITESVAELVKNGNDGVAPERKVTLKSALIVAERSLVASANRNFETRALSLVRDVTNFITLSKDGRVGEFSPTNTDLLSIGHPFSTASHSMEEKDFRLARARWIASDPRISQECRSLVSSAYAAEPDSVEQDFAIARLQSLPAGSVPSEIIVASAIKSLVAVGFGFNDGANKGFWRRQWRDMKKRFAKMGRATKVNYKDKDGKVKSFIGPFVGAHTDPNFGKILVKGDPNVPDGIYLVPSNSAEMVMGKLNEEALKKAGIDLSKKDASGEISKSLDKDIPNLEDIQTLPITEEDSKLANPIAQLPAGMKAVYGLENVGFDDAPDSFVDKIMFNTEADIDLVDKKLAEFLKTDKKVQKSLDSTKFGKYLSSKTPVSDALTDFSTEKLSKKDLQNLLSESSYETGVGTKQKELSNVLQALSDYFDEGYDPKDYLDSEEQVPEVEKDTEKPEIEGFDYSKADDSEYVDSFLDGFDNGVYAKEKKEDPSRTPSQEAGYNAGQTLGEAKYDESLEKAQEDFPRYGQPEQDFESKTALNEARDEVAKPIYDSLEKLQKSAEKSAPEATEEEKVIGQRFTDWTFPSFAYPIQNDVPYEVSGALADIYGADATDDPKVIANMFDKAQLSDALFEAIAGDDGDGTLNFPQAGEVLVPAEAIYDAMLENNFDADAVVAQAYDAVLGNEENTNKLNSFRKSTVPAGQIAELDKDSLESRTASELNVAIASQKYAKQASDLIESFKTLEDPDMDNIVDAINSADLSTGDSNDYLERPVAKLISEFLPWAFSDEEGKRQAFRGMLGIVATTDGNQNLMFSKTTGIINQIYKNSDFYDNSKSPEENLKTLSDAVYPDGISYDEFIRSRAKVAIGEEDPDSPESYAGATYKLAGKLSQDYTTQFGFQRGFLTPVESVLENYTKKGSIVSFDMRPFTEDPNQAQRYAKTLWDSGHPDGIVLKIDGPVSGVKTDALTNYWDEKELLVSGDFEITDVQQKKGGALNSNYVGRRVFEVTLKPVAKEQAIDLSKFKTVDKQAQLLQIGDLVPKTFLTSKGAQDAVSEERKKDPNFELPPLEEVVGFKTSDGYMESIIVLKNLKTGETRNYRVNGTTVLVDVRVPINSTIPGDNSPRLLPKNQTSNLENLSMVYDLKDYKQVSGQLGSNKGGIFEDSTGNQIYVKEPKTDLHGDNEVLASALYELAGVPAVKVRNGELADGTKVTFSEMVPNSNADFADKVNDPEYRKKVQDGFVVDAWLANWDVAGTGFDNIVSDANDEPVRVDPGGALLFRAQGAPKGNAFNDKVTELDTLVDPSQNQWSAKTFQDMSEEDKVESAKKLLDISDEEIDNYVNASITDEEARTKLSELLKARKATILNRYSLEEGAEDGGREQGQPESGEPAGPEGQGTVPEDLGPRRGRDDGPADSDGNKEWATVDRKVEDNERVAELKAQGKNASDVYELDSERDAQAFKDGIERLKEGNPFFSSVYAYTVEEYKNMRLFMTADGTAGFALKGDDIVSVFVPEGPHKGSARSFIARAVGLGGRRLDAFDTNLPHIYSKEGFVPVSRLTWDEGQAPTTWDKEVYSEFNNGEPDVVFMAYDPERIESKYDSSEGEYFVEYGDAVAAQDQFIQQKESLSTEPNKLTGYEIVQNDNGVYSPEKSLTSDDLYALRSGEKVPPSLPFIPVNTDSGETTYFDSTGVPRWGQYGASGALLRRQNENGEFEFLITKRSGTTSTSPSKWSVPGGAHSSPADKGTTTTAKKELSEELGVDVNQFQAGPRTKYSYQASPDWSYTYEMLDVENLEDYEFKLSNEIVDTRWVSAGELSQLQAEGELHEDFNQKVVSDLLELSNNKDYTPSTISSTKWWKHDKDENGNLIKFASKTASSVVVGDIIHYKKPGFDMGQEYDLLVTNVEPNLARVVDPATGEKNSIELTDTNFFSVISNNQSAQEQLKLANGDAAYNPRSGKIIDSANVDSPQSKSEQGSTKEKVYPTTYLNGDVTIMSYVLEETDAQGDFKYYKANPDVFADTLYAEISPSGENVFDAYISLDRPELLQKYSFETLEQAKAWVGENVANSLGSETNPITKGSLGEFKDIKPHKGGFLKPATENQIKLVKILLEEKQIDPELKEKILSETQKSNYVGGEAGAHISLLKSLEDLPEEVAKESYSTELDSTLNTSYSPDLSDDTVSLNLDKASDQINPAKILDALQKSHEDSYYLDNGDLVIAERGYRTSYNKDYNYKLAVRRTKDKERFFTYVIKTNMQTGDVELLKTSKEGHSYKTMMNKLKSAKLGVISSADPNTWFNKQKTKVEKLLPDFDVSEKIEEVLNSKTDAELANKIKEIIVSLGSGASYSINKTVLDSLNKAVKNGSLSQKSLELIIEDMVISRIEQATSIPDYILGNIDKIPPFPWMSFNGKQLKEGDTVDWTEIKTGKVFRGKVVSLIEKHGTKNYVYSDQTLVEFPDLEKQRWRVSSNLIKVDEGDPISAPFYAKQYEYDTPEKVITPQAEEVQPEPQETGTTDSSTKKYLGDRIFQIDEDKFVVAQPKEFATQSLAIGEVRYVPASDLKPGDYLDLFEKNSEVLYKEDEKDDPDRVRVIVYSAEKDSTSDLSLLKTHDISVVSGMPEKKVLSKKEATDLVKKQNEALASLSNLQDVDSTENSAFYVNFLDKLFKNLKTNSDIQQTLTNLQELSDAITKKSNEISKVNGTIVTPVTPANTEPNPNITNYFEDLTKSTEGIIDGHRWDSTVLPSQDQDFFDSFGITEYPLVGIDDVEGISSSRFNELRGLTYSDFQKTIVEEANNKALYIHPLELYLASYELDDFYILSGYREVRPYMIVTEKGKFESNSLELSEQNMSSGVVLSVNTEDSTAKVAWRVGPKAGQEEYISGNDLYVGYSGNHRATPKYIQENNLEIDKNYLEKVEEKKKDYLTKLAKAYENAKNIVEYKFATSQDFDYGTGEKTFIPNSVLGWNETDFDGTVSLIDALKNVDSDLNLANNGQEVLVDAGDIEDNSIRVFKVIDQELGIQEDPAKKIKLSFSLNPWVTDSKLVESLDRRNEEKDEDVKVYDEVIFRKLFINQNEELSSPAGPTTSDYFSHHIAGKYNGKTYKVAIKNSAGEKIGYYLLYRAGVEQFPSEFKRYGSEPISYHNKVEIYLNENQKSSGVDAIETSLRAVGIEQIRPATKQDIKTLNENKIIALVSGKETNSENYKGQLRKKVLDDAYKTYGMRAEDIETVDKNGNIVHLLPEKVGKDLADYVGVKYLSHDLTIQSSGGGDLDDDDGTKRKNDLIDFFYSILSSGELKSTISRWQSGVNTTGASSSTDATTLGSDYVFVRGASKDEIDLDKNKMKFGGTLLFDASKLFRRLDFHSNISDEYGFKYGSNHLDKLALSRRVTEVMFKDQITFDMLYRIDIGSLASDDVIKKLEDNGIDTIGGHTIFDIFNGVPNNEPEAEVETAQPTPSEDLKNKAFALKKAYEDSDLRTLATASGKTKPVKGFGTSKTFVADKPSKESTELKNLVVDAGKSVLAKADEIFEQKKLEIESKDGEPTDSESQESGNQQTPQAETPTKDKLTKLVLDKLYSKKSFGWFDEVLGSDFYEYNGEENVKFKDKQEDSYIKESVEYSGEVGQKYLAEKPGTQAWLKKNGLSLSKLKSAGVAEETLNRYISRGILNKVWDEDGGFTRNNPDDSYSKFWKETVSRDGVELTRTEALVNDLREISDYKDSISKAVKENLPIKPITKDDLLRKAKRDSLKEALEEAGVEFDSISLEQFGDRIRYSSSKKALSTSKGQAYKSITEAFNFIPKKTLEKVLDYLEKKPVYIKTGVARGHYSEGGTFSQHEITLSADSRSLNSDETYTDVALHEFFHLIQRVEQKVSMLEHAWLFDRVATRDTNGEEIVPAPFNYNYGIIGKYNGSEPIIPSNLPNYYISKYYLRNRDLEEESQITTLSPSNRASEVMTVGIQMFTSPDTYSEGKKLELLVKPSKATKISDAGLSKKFKIPKRTVEVLEDGRTAYFNPADGKWYKDSAFTIPIDPDTIVGQVGKVGRDDDYMSFVLGTLLGMS